MTELHQPAATYQQPPSAGQPNQPNHPGGAIGVQTTEKTSLPAGGHSAVDPASGNTYYVDPQNQTHWNLPSSEQPNQPNHPGGAIGVQTTEKTSLPAGWYSAVDPASGNTYYVDPQNQTHWNLPSSELPISQMDIATVHAELEKDDIAPDRAAALHGRLQ